MRGFLFILSGGLDRTSELFFQVAARIAVRAGRYFVRCAAHDHAAALRASFRAEVDDVVGTFDDVHIVFDDDERMAAQDESVESRQQAFDVVEMQPRGRFVEDENGRFRFLHAEIVGQFHALVLAARKGIGRLTQLDVAQSHVLQRFEFFRYLGLPVRVEELDGLVYRHVEHVINVLPAEFHFQQVTFEPFAVARLAFQHEVGHELHFHRDRPFAFAFLATSAFGVEREEAGREAHLLGQRLCGEQFAYLVVGLDVGDGVAARRLADGILVHELDILYHLQVAFQSEELARTVGHFVELPFHGAIEDVAHEGGLTRSADSRDHRHDVEREAYVDSAQVVGPCAFHFDIVCPRAYAVRQGDGFLSRQVFHGVASRVLRFLGQHLLQVALEYYLAAQASGLRPDVDDIVCRTDDFLVMFHHDDRVA